MYPSIGSKHFQENIATTDEFFETIEPNINIQSIQDFIQLRESSCIKTDFKINKQQLWIKRFLSPWTPYKSAILVHSLGTGKSCSAIGIAEEYITHNNQNKVIVIASADVAENFKSEIFNINKVSTTPPWKSSQCTANNYIKRVQRLQRSLLNLSAKDDRKILEDVAKKIIDDHYEFHPYMAWANTIIQRFESMSKHAFSNWIKDNFNNRLIIVDEAHNSRPSQASNEKKVEMALRLITKEANNMNLVLLTATPMYNEWSEILWLLNLCIWNDKRTELFNSYTEYNKGLQPSMFNQSLEFTSNTQEKLFRTAVKSYISFIRGNNPFQFPFRLEPPIVLDNHTLPSYDIYGKPVKHKLNIKLVPSLLSGPQLEHYKSLLKDIPNIDIDQSLEQEFIQLEDNQHTAITKIFAAGNIFLPEGNFYKSFQIKANPIAIQYNIGSPRFFDPNLINSYAAKFKTIIDAIQNAEGICFIYSTYNLDGIFPLVLALEQYGFHPYLDKTGIWTEVPPEQKNKGAYVVFTGNTKLFPKQLPIEELKNISKHPSNKDGSKIKIIIGSKKVSEGLDFANIRQIHILEPWYNTALLDQVIGRGLRTCSHAGLPFDKQNCTVYLHTAILPPELNRETMDITAYRISEQKAIGISKILSIIKQSAFDCIINYNKNHIDNSILNLQIKQIRSQDNTIIQDSIQTFTKPLFDYEPIPQCEENLTPQDISHNTSKFTPIHFLTDRQEELIDELRKLFHINYTWSWDDIINKKELKQFNQKSIALILDEIVRLPNQYPFIDKLGRKGFIQRRQHIYAFIPEDIRYVSGATTFERTQPSLTIKKNLIVEQSKQTKLIKQPSQTELLQSFINQSQIETQTLTQLNLSNTIINQSIIPYTFDKLNIKTRYNLFIELIKNNTIGNELNLYTKIVTPRIIQLSYIKDQTKINTQLALIINPQAKLQFITLSPELNFNEPSTSLQIAIDNWKQQFKKDFINSNRGELEGLSEVNPKTLKFTNKIFVSKNDFRGHDCTTFKKNELDQYIKQINYTPQIDYKRDDVCKVIDISIRYLAMNDSEGYYKYIIPESFIA